MVKIIDVSKEPASSFKFEVEHCVEILKIINILEVLPASSFRAKV
jgi:hypothetical protein